MNCINIIYISIPNVVQTTRLFTFERCFFTSEKHLSGVRKGNVITLRPYAQLYNGHIKGREKRSCEIKYKKTNL